MSNDVDFGTIINRATSLWKGNFGTLVLISFVFLLVVWIPVANVAFVAGYFRAVLKVARGKNPCSNSSKMQRTANSRPWFSPSSTALPAR